MSLANSPKELTSARPEGAPVMMTTNLCTEWGLFNGSMGIIADIYFANGRKPALDGKEHPDAILVHMPGYCGPEVIQGHPPGPHWSLHVPRTGSHE